MVPRIQIAVQGGGAKLCDLLAAMEAIQKLERAKVLEVTRLAGTSAGSIAAALYAADVDFPVLRQKIQQNSKTLLGLFPVPTRMQFAKAALLGKPIVDLQPLKEALKTVLAEKKVYRFKDLRKPLAVMATDLTNGKSHPCEDPEEFVVGAVVDSCAIPYYFRAPGKKSDAKLVVDGGICENLPVDLLMRYPDDGHVIGVTFAPGEPGVTPDGVLSFARAILEAAMNNSVRRAQLRLGDDRLLLLDGDIDTFDFPRAISEGMAHPRYEATVGATTAFFTRVANAAKPQAPVVVEPGPESDQSESTLQRVAELYKAQHERVKMRYSEVRMIVRVGCLSLDGATGKRQRDHLSYRLVFAAATEPLACATIRVMEPPGSGIMGTIRKEVWDNRGAALRTIDLLGRDRASPNFRLYLLFFNPTIKPEDPNGPFTFEYAHPFEDLMLPLAVEGVDSIAIQTTRADGPTSRAILVALIPDAFPNIGIRASAETTGNVPGRRMTDEELRLLNLRIEPDHHILGWVGDAIPPNTTFAAELYQPNFTPPRN